MGTEKHEPFHRQEKKKKTNEQQPNLKTSQPVNQSIGQSTSQDLSLVNHTKTRAHRLENNDNRNECKPMQEQRAWWFVSLISQAACTPMGMDPHSHEQKRSESALSKEPMPTTLLLLLLFSFSSHSCRCCFLLCSLARST